MTQSADLAPDRRQVAAGLGAGLILAGTGAPALSQLAGLEVVSSGPRGDGQDQLARALAEGLALTRLTPRAMAVNEPSDIEAIADFVAGKRPRAALMVFGLSTLGALHVARATTQLDQARPLARILGEQQPIVVPATSKIKSIAQLADAIRADAGAVTWAGRALGSADHLLCLRVTKAAGGDLSRVSYRPSPTSAEASNLVLKGGVTVGTGALVEYMQQIRGGTLSALALASPERATGLDIPTLQELGVDVTQLNWRGVITLDSVGEALIERYGEAIARVALTPGWGELMRARFWVDMTQRSADFKSFLSDERKRVAELISV